ncbi:MAG: carboxypeptidase regulatory-like domain-containing protein [Gemmatimonadetes bacterium]|nr:carboxypeptidase regulatory-like domain-containing protein [Gemmatimonadota bacterium]
MTQNCVRALARTALALAAVAFGAGASTLHAQGATGKIDGRVKDAAGQPLAGARVIIVGTAFTATTNQQGYYFFNSVSAGSVTLRATYIGYKSSQVENLRVLSGQTSPQDIIMEQSAVNVGDITVTSAAQPLVPRDQVATKQLIDGGFVDKLPVDNVSRVLQLQPGVTTTNGGGISVRGSRTDEQNTYIDGVPVQSGVRSGGASGGFSAGISVVAVNGFEDASITTGAASAEFGNAQGGIVAITTKTGGSKFAGNVSWETDMLAPARYRGGFNMFQGGFGGPIKGALTFYVSGRLEGSQGGNRGYQTWELASWAPVGIDTTFTLPKTFGNVRSDSIVVPVYQYAVISGECDKMDFVTNAALQAMRDNYGQSCASNSSRNGGVSTQYNGTAKLNYTFGGGSRISATYLLSGNQARNRKADGLTAGSENWSNVATLNWNQQLIRGASKSLSIDAYASYQWNSSLAGRITDESEAGSRDPMFGILLKKLNYVYTADNFPLDSTLLKNILTNKVTNRIGLTDRINTSQYSGQGGYGGAPDGVGYGAGGGGGFDNAINYQIENRKVFKANLDWQADRYNRIKFGGEYTGYDITAYGGGNISTYLVKPYRYNFFAEDRIDLGDVIVVGGLRYDYFLSNARRWNGFPRISTAPGFTADSLDNFLVTDPSHDYISPAIQVAFPVTEKTNFRLSYRHQAQSPDLGLVLQNSLTDIDAGGANSRSNWGGDLDFGKTILFEFGVRHAFSDDMVLDLAAYNKDNLANASYQFAFPVDPVGGQPTRIFQAQNADFGNTRGLDLRLDRRIGNYVNGSLSYSFQDTKSTGSDPTSYRNFYEPLPGNRAPLAATTTTFSRPHTIAGSFQVTLPADFQQGSILGAVLKRTGFYATFRLASGTPYTRCDVTDPGSVGVRSGGSCAIEPAQSSFLGARLPAAKEFDLRVTKNFQLGKFDMTGYLDGRNILNLKVVNSVWATTGTIQNAAQDKINWNADSLTFATFGTQNGFRRVSDGALTLPATDAACALSGNGTNTTGAQCFYYRKSEQRFGNGDAVYTLAEQRAASDNNRAGGRHISNYVGAGRRLRFGLEVNF